MQFVKIAVFSSYQLFTILNNEPSHKKFRGKKSINSFFEELFLEISASKNYSFYRSALQLVEKFNFPEIGRCILNQLFFICQHLFLKKIKIFLKLFFCIRDFMLWC